MNAELEKAIIEMFEINGEVDSFEYSGGEGLDVILTCTFEGIKYWTECWRDKHGDLHDIGESAINKVN